MLIEMNRYPEALEQFTAAAAVNEHLAAREPGCQDRRLAYADAIANISRIRLHERNEAECLRLRAESVAIRKQMLAGGDNRKVYYADVGGSLATYGWALREFGHYREALAAYEESNSLTDEVLRSSDLTNFAMLLLKAETRSSCAAY